MTATYRPRAFDGRDRQLDGGPECRGDRVVRDRVDPQRDRESEARPDDTRGGQPDTDGPHRWPAGPKAAQQRARRARDQAEPSGDHADRPDDSGGGHDPTGQRGRHQSSVQPRRSRVGDGCLRHRAQTRTSGRSFSRRPGPIPSTSPSWSTLVNLPWASRHAAIAAAITGPTPGRVSSCCTVAVLRLIGCAGAPFAGRDAELVGPGALEPGLTELPRTAGWPLIGAIPTTICSPSSTWRAMLSPMVSAPSVVPPAAFRASAM